MFLSICGLRARRDHGPIPGRRTDVQMTDDQSSRIGFVIRWSSDTWTLVIGYLVISHESGVSG